MSDDVTRRKNNLGFWAQPQKIIHVKFGQVKSRKTQAKNDQVLAQLGAKDFYPLSIMHFITGFASQMGATKIFTVIPLFYLSCNKSPLSRVTPSHWGRERVHAGVPGRIGALNKSPNGLGIPVSLRERAHGRGKRRKSPKNHFTIAGIGTHYLSLLSQVLHPLDHGALPSGSNLLQMK